jgi:hypothetical protein
MLYGKANAPARQLVGVMNKAKPTHELQYRNLAEEMFSFPCFFCSREILFLLEIVLRVAFQEL